MTHNIYLAKKIVFLVIVFFYYSAYIFSYLKEEDDAILYHRYIKYFLFKYIIHLRDTTTKINLNINLKKYILKKRMGLEPILN